MSRLDDLLEQIVGPARPPEILVPAGHAQFFGVESADTEGTQSFSVTNGTPLDTRVSFVVGSVIIDNNTSSWINIPDATKDGTGRFVAPGTGAAFPILGHISRARVNWLAPPGKTQPAAIATEAAQVIFLAAGVPPSLGFAQPRNAVVQKNQLINATIAALATLHLIPAIAGVTLTLYWLAVATESTAVGSVTFQSSATGLGLINVPYGLPASSYFPMPPVSWPYGITLPTGEGVDIVNGGNIATNANGALVFSTS